MTDKIREAEDALRQARADDRRARHEESQQEPYLPVMHNNKVYGKASEISARELGVPMCGYVDPDYNVYKVGCTRPRDHRGTHGEPNWESHAEVEARFGGVYVELRSEHDSRGKRFSSYEEYRAFWDAVDALVKGTFEALQETDHG